MKMRKSSLTVLALFVLLILNGCKVDKGTPVIKKDKMVEILADIYLAQSILEQEQLNLKDAKKEYYYCNTLERYGVTEELFDSAIGWYAANMDVFEQVYADVVVKLEQKKTDLEQQP